MKGETIVTAPFRRPGRFISRGAQLAKDRLVPGSPFNVRANARTPQRVIQHFEGQLGVVANVMDTDDPDVMKARASVAAYSMVDEGMVDQDTVVELRALVPADALRRRAFTQTALASMNLIKNFLDEYDVRTVASSLPIMPTEHGDSPVDPDTVWDAISPELDGLERQMRPERGKNLAMLAITEAPYAERLFQDQSHFPSGHLQAGRVMVMHSVGETPRENLLLPPRATSPLEGLTRSVPSRPR